MGRQKKLEEIRGQDAGDLLILKLESHSFSEKDTVAAGYYWGDGKIYSTSGNGNLIKKTFKRVTDNCIDISNGTYLGSKILSYEVVRKYKPKK